MSQVLDALRRDERPKFADLKTLDELLKDRDPVMHHKLEDYARQATAWILGVIGRLATPPDIDLLAATVLSGESALGEASPGETTGVDAATARYLTVLLCLLGRTCDFLSRLPGPHEVAVHVATRGIVDPKLGRQSFDLTHLREMIRQAMPSGTMGVHLHAASTPEFDWGADARIVLADFVANQARYRVGGSCALRKLEKRLASVAVGLLQSGAPRLSHVAASGWAREHIEAARRDAPAPPAPRGCQVLGAGPGDGMGGRAAATPLMRDLSLLDAFRGCGPVLGVPEVDEVREIAAARLLGELRALSRRLQGFNPDIRDEATQVVLVRLFKAGPRGTRHGDPESEASLRGYLLTALRNAARDLLPRRHFGEITATVEAAAANPVGRPDQELEALDQESSARRRIEDDGGAPPRHRARDGGAARGRAG